MTQRMTVDQAAQYFERLGPRLEGAFALAFRESLLEGVEVARGLSSGPYTLAALRRMYNPRGPYSRAAPHPPADPAIINVQSGRFKAAWRAEMRIGFHGGSGRARGVILNDAPEVKYLKGTRRMMARPVLDLLGRKMRPVIIRRFTEAVERALR